ncbi:MAG: exodeoxyribonuclease III [Gammaproteobacteria bacterium]|nr:exodeoxyribonuclease III [Gammaproteobacteria bacterium]MCH9763170.1 exodeoxyribonuclease III [Gammaproteobacteria bacterium]
MRVISLNANGIRSAARKGFFEWLEQQSADFICIQETKAQREQLEADPTFFPQGYYCEYVDAVKKGYSGVAIYAREKPVSVVKSLGFELSDVEGRYLQFDYPGLSVASIYLPSGTTGDIRQNVKYDFLEQFQMYLNTLRASGRACIVCGDYNIAHHNIDIKNWRPNQKHSGFLPEERAWLDDLFGAKGFVDAFREVNQLPSQYTWWSNRGQARANNVGWRIDYQVITSELAPFVLDATISPEPFFSDHAPLIIDYKEGFRD